MKRIQFACLNQTIHFQLKDGVNHDFAVSEVKNEFKSYKKHLELKRIKYQIIEETIQEDGSIIIKIKKQMNSYDVGNYLN